jgi:hypothetical protein
MHEQIELESEIPKVVLEEKSSEEDDSQDIDEGCATTSRVQHIISICGDIDKENTYVSGPIVTNFTSKAFHPSATMDNVFNNNPRGSP